MPRPGPRRPYIGIRLDDDMLTWLDEQAKKRGLNRSEMIRLTLEVGRAFASKALNRSL